MPSVEPEAQSLSVLEAMSVGVPVVGTDHGGIPETLGEAGLVVPPGDAGALATAVSRLISDPALRRRCRTAGPLRVATSYALSERITELLDAIAAPLRGPRSRPLRRSARATGTRRRWPLPSPSSSDG